MALLWVTAIEETIGRSFGLVKEALVKWQKQKTIKVQAATEVEKFHATAQVTAHHPNILFVLVSVKQNGPFQNGLLWSFFEKNRQIFTRCNK